MSSLHCIEFSICDNGFLHFILQEHAIFNLLVSGAFRLLYSFVVFYNFHYFYSCHRHFSYECRKYVLLITCSSIAMDLNWLDFPIMTRIADIDVISNDWNDLDFNEDIDPNTIDIHTKLTTVTRQQYFQYLENILVSNNKMNRCAIKCVDRMDIHVLAVVLERKAVEQCMLFDIYQKIMLNIITEIRLATENGEIYMNKNFWLKANELRDRLRCERFTNKKNIGVQTEKVSAMPATLVQDERSVVMSLEEKILRFQQNLQNVEKKRKSSLRNLCEEMKKSKLSRSENVEKAIQLCTCITAMTPNTPTTTATATAKTPINTVENNEIAREMSELFGDNDPVAPSECDIFEENKNSQIDAILSEINQFNPLEIATQSDACGSAQCEKLAPPLSNVIEAAVHQSSPSEIVSPTPVTPKPYFKSPVAPVTNLKDSIWPCELHMQRLRLRKLMSDKAEKGLRHCDKVRKKILLLFGNTEFSNNDCIYDVDEDCDGPYSPSIELIDPILMGSCKKRIAPWIVQYLMQAMNEGLIANRYLFKKLAKHLAQEIILNDQYPGK